jgi:hypothetical protein
MKLLRRLDWRVLVVFLLTAAALVSPWDATSQGNKALQPGQLQLPDIKIPDPPQIARPTASEKPPPQSDPSMAEVTNVSTMAEALQYFVGFRFRHEPWTMFDTDYMEILRVTEEVVVMQRGTTRDSRTTLPGDVLIVPISSFHTLVFDALGESTNRRLKADKLGVR